MPNLNPVNFFRVVIPEVDTIGMFMRCDGLSITVEVMQYQEGGRNNAPHNLPGRVSYPNLSLTRGLTNQDALTKWFDDTRTKAELKEIRVELLSHKDRSVLRSWAFVDAFPVKWNGPSFVAGDSNPATESLEIAHGGLTGF